MSYPNAPQRTGTGCTHQPMMNMDGDVISPVVVFGQADNPYFQCKKCKKRITEAAHRKALALGEDEPTW